MKPEQDIKNTGADGYTVELQNLVLGGLGRYLRSFSIDASDDGLVLRGFCDSFHVKQMVQETVSKNTSQRIVANDLVVESSADRRTAD